mmetsp:Transcript_18573/g.31772  ORF Transcript_18573/g.31772 Transcript_18573/m.31772 type:complete len:131 (-) Transcript_18573:307-699(-)
MPEHNFYVQQSSLSIYRYEDLLFNIFPHMAGLKRRGATIKEIFASNDPFEKGGTNHPTTNISNQSPMVNGMEQHASGMLGSTDRDVSRNINGSRENYDQMEQKSIGAESNLLPNQNSFMDSSKRGLANYS